MSNSGSNSGSNKGRQQFVLDANLQLQRSRTSSHSGGSAGLNEDASRKHTATYTQLAEGPVELGTLKAMALAVHAARPGKSQPLNSVAIFHESALPTVKPGVKTRLTLKTEGGSVFNTTKATGDAVTRHDVTTMVFDGLKNNNHLNKF